MIRACTLTELPAWTQFLNEAFQYGANEGSYAVDFAPLFEEDSLKNSRLYIEDGKILSSATVYPVEMQIRSGEKYKIGIIGAVATAEAARGRGLSTAVLQSVEDVAKKLKLSALVLWSDQLEFYSKFGFHAFGNQQVHALGAYTVNNPVLGKRAAGWRLPSVEKLYGLHAQKNIRDQKYWNALLKVRSCEKWSWISPEGEVLAYVGLGRGKDMHNVIHEWAGNALALKALVADLCSERVDLLWLTSSLLTDPIRDSLNAPPILNSHLALLKNLDVESTIQEQELWFWGLDSL